MSDLAIAEPPVIFIVGAQRSGTTLAYNLIRECPRICGISEARNIWDWMNWGKPDDYLDHDDVTRLKRSHAYRRLHKQLKKTHGAERFLEKSPSNCFRIDFLNAMFPNAFFVVIARNGLHAIHSTLTMTWGQNYSWKRMTKRISRSTLTELPGLISRLPILWSKLLRRRPSIWGVRPPGWKSLVENPYDLAVYQWTESVSYLMDGIKTLPDERLHQIRYEHLLENPQLELTVLFGKLGFENAAELASAGALSVRKPSGGDDFDFISKIDPVRREQLDSCLSRLGYDRL